MFEEHVGLHVGLLCSRLNQARSSHNIFQASCYPGHSPWKLHLGLSRATLKHCLELTVWPCALAKKTLTLLSLQRAFRRHLCSLLPLWCLHCSRELELRALSSEWLLSQPPLLALVLHLCTCWGLELQVAQGHWCQSHPTTQKTQAVLSMLSPTGP